ncbi:DNA translocase FtsK 4TM domain-containing protein [Roseibacterium beibuensis]|uniref:DNA translocase FtsK n=1 Tax=[Roseibacterium] beibuensis TaxID=1193142 RepID=A0ABP9LK47_9RHOB|nr:DNA translocase FtsK [Roseibacterium beibuensis]MCS6626109.1 DNA translocase FtsK 4TM domain-containing protein [Roseibacterium beibuensis]
MAYQTRQRDPLLDDEMQAALVRRGQEMIGFVLVALGIALSAMLISYTPEDPNWMAATDAPPQNLMGRTGASIAAILMMIVGYGALALPIGCFAWGLRFLLHTGSERALARILFLPIALALASIYAASHVPPEGWTHSFGLGGLFGDTVLGAVLNALPMGPQAGLKLVAALAFVAGLGLMLYVVGTSRGEMRLGLRFLLIGLFTSGAMVTAALRGLGRGAGQAAGQLRDARAARMAERGVAYEDDGYDEADGDVAPLRGFSLRRAPRDEDPALYEDEPPLRRGGGLLSRVPLLRPREPQPEMLEPELPERSFRAPDDIEAPDEDRIRAKISDVIRNRVRRPSPVAAAAQRRLQAGPLPSAAPSRVVQSPALRAEPPLTAAHVPQGAQDVVDDTGLDDENLFAKDGTEPVAPAAPAPRAAGGTELQRRVVQHAMKRQTAPSRRAVAEAQPSLPLQPQAEVFEFPPLTLLTNPDTIQRHHLSDEALEENARMLENVLDDYGVKGEIVSVRPGPVVTMYELEPAPGLKASRVIGLADDIARSMSALSARVSTVPGRSVIGIELPNQHREKVVLREILSSREFGDGTQKLPLALGKDIGGEPIVANLAKMPHLLIAGTTGSGKSVAINTMILSLLYKLPPEDCRMIMIDPKMLELSVYDGIPHLLSPVVTDPKKAVVALKWVVAEMEERYRKMSKMGVRNIDGYNGRVADALAKGEMFSRTVQTGFDDETGDPVFETEEFAPEKMPYIVVIVDEMADLMMVAGKEIEACIQRLAQMARASGIHLVMATQRPSVDVITGTIKANFPTRISFHVTSKVDSRTILGEQGAEQLLGMGDMLYMAGGSKITRVHGPFVSDEEVEEIVRHLKSFGPPDYAASVLDGPDEDKESDIDAVLGLNTGGNTTGEDALYDQAVAIVVKDRKCSTSYIQRKLGIGYNKAARLVEQMEEQGLVSAANHVGKREILVPEQE